MTASVDFEKYIHKQDKIRFEFIDLPQPPPPTEAPPLQMEKVKELPKEEALFNEEIAKELEALINESSDEAQLTLASSNSSFLTSESQLGKVVGTDFNYRKVSKGDADLKIGNRGLANLSEGSSLDIGKSRRRNQRKIIQEESSSLSPAPIERKGRGQRPPLQQESKLDIKSVGKNEKILSFSSSTIGTEDYKVWNKINSELDRLNKGRYGSVPEEIKHHRGGFIVNFTFQGGVQHQINWQRDGNVWIKVIGKSSKTTLQELRRALNGLIGLSLK